MNRTGDNTGVACIRLLREAEARGHQLIIAARNRKIKRVKEARIEAEAEANQFKKEREEFLRENQAVLAHEHALHTLEITQRAEDEMEDMEERVQACSPQVVELLERLVCHIKPDVHHNLHVCQEIEAGRDSHINFQLDSIVEEMVNKCLSNCDSIASKLISDKNNNSSSDA